MKIGQAKCIYCGYKTTTGGIIEHQKNCKMKPNAVEEMNKAVKCLYLELPEAIADDVRQKWEAAYEFLSHPEQGEQDDLNELMPETKAAIAKLAEKHNKAEQGEQGELYKWVKASEGVPQNPDMKQWRFSGTFKPVIWEQAKRMAVSENYSDEVEWLCKLSSPPPEGQDELWDLVETIFDKYTSPTGGGYEADYTYKDGFISECKQTLLLIKK